VRDFDKAELLVMLYIRPIIPDEAAGRVTVNADSSGMITVL
jgi:hypothetical protein